MRALILAAGLLIIPSIVCAQKSKPNYFDQFDEPPKTLAPKPSISTPGRFQICYSPGGMRRDTFLLDTCSGRVWMMVGKGDSGEASGFEELPRYDLPKQ